MNGVKFFISYSHDDSETAEKIRVEIRNANIDCFLDCKDIDWADTLTDKLGRGLAECTHLLLILSPASLKSNWVFYEVGRAMERGTDILIFLTHKSLEPPGFLKDRVFIHSIDKLRDELEKLVSNAQNRAEAIREQLLRIPRIIDKLPTNERARKAIKYSINALLNTHHISLDGLERGELTARAPEMYRIYGHFIEACETFRAISVEDLDYWTMNDSREYLDQNQKLIEKNGRVERIFLLKHTAATVVSIMDQLRQAIIPQMKMGIKVSLAFYYHCDHLGDRNNIRDLDFGLFDNFAVSFFRLGQGRSYTISLHHVECDYRRTLYDSVLRRCEKVPNKTRAEQVFETESELNRWAEFLKS